MTTSILKVRLDSNDKNIFALMCIDLGIKRPSIAIKMLIKDCIRKRSILGLDCNIPEVVDENGYNRDERDRSSTEVRQKYLWLTEN
jgi:antitoxin component of RelBE/YafQ-DinJ toxin-antitoxin module